MEYLVNESSPITAVIMLLGFLRLIGIVILPLQAVGVDVDAKPQVAHAKPKVAKPVVIRSTKIYSINPYKLCAILADNLYLF
jgi:hypothetical protein